MSNSTKRLEITLVNSIVVLTIAALLLTGCSGSSNDETVTEGKEILTPPITGEATPTVVEEENPATSPTPTDEVIDVVTLDHVIVDPEVAKLGIEETLAFTAIAFDADGNEIPDVKMTWETEENLGIIGNDGTLTAGTTANIFDESVKVNATFNNDSVEGFASVTVNPGPPESIAISAIEISAGDTQQLEVAITDAYGNPVGDLNGTWSLLDENAGILTDSGRLIAGEVAGEFTDVVQVEVEQDGETHTAIASLTIVPGSLDQVVIAPDLIDLGIEMTQQFMAIGADQYGNRTPDVAFEWTIENGGGTIDEDGLFIAGKEPDVYKDTVKVVATNGDVITSTTADVTIEPDRIAFLSDREDDQVDIYIMNADGTDIKRITKTANPETGISWSSDGRRICYDFWALNGGVFVMNDDGSWNLQIVEQEGFSALSTNPSLSPDGTKIAFVKFTNITEDYEEWKSDIYVVDIDGGNLTQLTDTPDDTEWTPAWSPDGFKLPTTIPKRGVMVISTS